MSIASFFLNLETQAAAYVKSVYETTIKPLVAKEAAAFKPLITATERDVVQYGLPIVLSFFGSAGAALAGGAKMGAAVPALINALGAAGKTIAVQDAQAGLQIIVNQVKAAASTVVPGVAQ